MSEIRALIVDDEPLARRGIRQLLESHRDVKLVGECRDGREAVRALATLKPDLVFLDIQMPGLDGLGVVGLYGAERMPFTVFVTAHDAFAVRAFESQALDYLVKPLSEARFGATMARVRERMRMDDAVAMAQRLSTLLAGDGTAGVVAGDALRVGGARRRISVRTDRGERLLDAEAIDWIEVDGDGSRVWSAGSAYAVRESLAALERALDPAQFVRVHRTALVRLTAVREVKSDAGRRDAVVVLADGTELPVSRRRLSAVRAALRRS